MRVYLWWILLVWDLTRVAVGGDVAMRGTLATAAVGMSKNELLEAMAQLLDQAWPPLDKAAVDSSPVDSEWTKLNSSVSNGSMQGIHLRVGVVVDPPLTRRKNHATVVAGNSREHYDGKLGSTRDYLYV